MNEILSNSFLTVALIGAIMSAVSTSLISVFVALKKVSYMSEAFAHMSFAGIALALLLGFNMNIVTLIFVISIAMIIASFSGKLRVEESNITAVLLSVSMAIGIILISVNRNLNIDISSFLFGNVLLIAKSDLIYLTGLLILNLLFIMMFFKELFYMSYNEEISAIYKIAVKPVYYIFLIILASNIVISVKISGIILITAQMILPGMSALNIVNRVRTAVILSSVIALISSGCGFFISFYLNLPTGAVIVLMMFIFYIVSAIIKHYKTET